MKTTIEHKNFSQIYREAYRKALIKFHMQLEILSCFGYGPKSLNV